MTQEIAVSSSTSSPQWSLSSLGRRGRPITCSTVPSGKPHAPSAASENACYDVGLDHSRCEYSAFPVIDERCRELPTSLLRNPSPATIFRTKQHCLLVV